MSASATTTSRIRDGRRGRVVPVLLAATVLVGGFSLSADAGGGKKPVLAGKTTKAGKTTTIKTTGNGPALRLKTKGGKPPLAVNSRGRVARLNADQVDGLDAADLATQTVVYHLPAGGAFMTSKTYTLPGLPGGTYAVSYTATLRGEATMDEGRCYLEQDDEPQYVALSYAATRSSVYSTVSGNGPVDRALGAPELRCNSTVPFHIEKGEVMFTRTSFDDRGVLAPALRPGRRPGRSSDEDRGAATS